MNWIFIGVLYVGLITLKDLYRKYLVGDRFDPLMVLLQAKIVSFVVISFIVTFTSIELPSSLFWSLLLVAIVTTLGSWCYLLALERTALSIAVPMLGLIPLWVALTEPLVTDTMYSIDTMIAAIVSFFGLFLIQRGDLVNPLEDRGLILALVAGIFYASSSVIQSRLVSTRADPIGISLMVLVLSLPIVIVLVLWSDQVGLWEIRSKIVPLGIFDIITSYVFLVGVNEADATRFNVIVQFSTIFSVGGGLLFGEEEILRRVIGSSFIVLSILLVV